MEQNKLMIAGVIIAVLVIAGLAGYFFLGTDDASDNAKIAAGSNAQDPNEIAEPTQDDISEPEFDDSDIDDLGSVI